MSNAWYKCPECDFKSPEESMVDEHVEIMHGSKESAVEKPE